MKSKSLKLANCVRGACVMLACLSLLATQLCSARSFNDEMAKKFVKLLLLGALLSPPGKCIARLRKHSLSCTL